MIKVKVNTLFQGKVAIRDKYLTEALKTKQDILVIHGQEQMIIRANELPVSKSAYPFRDRYSRESHFLLYYLWKPTVRQTVLI